MLQKQLVDGFARGQEVLAVQFRPQVVGDAQIHAAVEQLSDRLAGVGVAGENDRKAHIAAQARAGVRRDEHLGDVHQVRDGTAVRSAGHKHHVRTQVADALDLLPVLAPVVHRDDVHDDSARSERRALRALRAHALDDARDRHLQAAAGT